MRQHPEQRNDEIFVGNTSGTGVPPDRMRPLFVGRGEAAQYDAIMMARLSKQ